MSFKALLATSAIFAAQLVSGHSVITNAVGDAGGQGMALGVDTSTPRDGTRRNPFQQDATRFRGQAAKTVGETVGAGDNNVESGTKAIMAEMGGQLPQVSQGGNVQMTLHQVNGDGAGPYTCMINSDGTAQSWQNIQVTQNVEGNRGRNNAGAKTDHPLTAAIPANQQCTGQVAGQDNVCLVRCQNPARAGPFGGIVPVQMVGGNNGTTPNGANNAGNNAGNNNAGNNGNNNAGNNGNNGNAGNNGNNGNAGNNGNNNAGNNGSNGNAGNNGSNGNGGNNGNNGNAGNNGNNGNAGNNGNKNAGNNGNAKNGNNNNKRDMDVGAFVKRIDSETRAIEFTA